MKIIEMCGTVDKVDLFNAASASKPYKDLDTPKEVRGAYIAEDIDSKSGDTVRISGVITADGDAYGGNSSVILDSMSMLFDLLSDGEPIAAECVMRKTKDDKDFATLKLHRIS